MRWYQMGLATLCAINGALHMRPLYQASLRLNEWRARVGLIWFAMAGAQLLLLGSSLVALLSVAGGLGTLWCTTAYAVQMRRWRAADRRRRANP